MSSAGSTRQRISDGENLGHRSERERSDRDKDREKDRSDRDRDRERGKDRSSRRSTTEEVPQTQERSDGNRPLLQPTTYSKDSSAHKHNRERLDYNNGDMKAPSSRPESTSKRESGERGNRESREHRDPYRDRDRDHRGHRDKDREFSERRDKDREHERGRHSGERSEKTLSQQTENSTSGGIPERSHSSQEYESRRQERSRSPGGKDAPRSKDERKRYQQVHTKNTAHSYSALQASSVEHADNRSGDEKGPEVNVVSKSEQAPKIADIKVDDSDTEMAYEEARVAEPSDSTPKPPQTQQAEDRDMAIAMQMEMELEVNPNAHDSDSGSTTSAEYEPAPEAQQAGGTVQRLWSTVVSGAGGSASGPMTKEDKYRERARKLTKELDSAIMHYHDAERRANIARQQAHEYYTHIQQVGMEFQGARRHIAYLEDEARGLKSELQHLKQQLSDAVNLSEVRGKELKGAQVFLTKADTLSTSDVVQKVATLNEEVFQAAALLGETLVYETFEEGVDHTEQRMKAVDNEDNQSRARWMLGDYLAELLAGESTKPSEMPANPLLVQIVMQIALTTWCFNVSTMWKPGDPAHTKVLGGLYEEIRSTEDQAVSGRWRSLTRAHANYSTADWTNNIMMGVLAVMSIAGWATPTDSELEQFQKRLVSIFKAVQDVRKATGEDVTSADLEIATIEPNTPFNPSLMEDAYGDERASAKGQNNTPERVIATSGLGLKKVSIKRPQNGPIGKVQEMVSPPKVVLDKTIREAMEPPPPSRPKKKREGGAGAGGIMGFIGLS